MYESDDEGNCLECLAHEDAVGDQMELLASFKLNRKAAQELWDATWRNSPVTIKWLAHGKTHYDDDDAL